MRELAEIMDVGTLLALEPEELGAKMLFVMQQRLHRNRDDMFSLPGCRTLTDPNAGGPMRDARAEVNLALSEAWSWMEAQGLLVQAPGSNGGTGYRVLSRRALRFQNEAEFADFKVARRFPKEALHPRIADTVWQAFMRGEFAVAVFQATKAVEVYVREIAGGDELGVKLMRKAFDKHNGPLSDPNADEGEREAMAHLFAGAIGVYKNPHSHRDVNIDDPSEAIEIIMLSNRLLRIVDGRVARAPV